MDKYVVYHCHNGTQELIERFDSLEDAKNYACQLSVEKRDNDYMVSEITSTKPENHEMRFIYINGEAHFTME